MDSLREKAVKVMAHAAHPELFDEDPKVQRRHASPFSVLSRTRKSLMDARKQINALEDAGMVLLPKEPTEAMIAAGEQNNLAGDSFYDFAAKNVYEAMVSAALQSDGEG